MLGFILVICLIVLVIALVRSSNRNRELTEVQTRIAEIDLKSRKETKDEKQKSKSEIYETLKQLKFLLDEGAISKEEYDAEKKSLLGTEQENRPIVPPPQDDEDRTIEFLESQNYKVNKSGYLRWEVTEPDGSFSVFRSFQDLLAIEESIKKQGET